jgi:hypothetical protein
LPVAQIILYEWVRGLYMIICTITKKTFSL